MKIKITFVPIILTILTVGLLRCTNDKTPIIDNTNLCQDIIATYDLNIKTIIDNNCTLGGCHVNGGDGPGVYVSYNNLIPFIEDGSFERTVVIQREDPNIGMPPDWSTNGAPKDLTAEELELVECWIENGYPEN